jgi:hypothetical protein
MRVVWGESGQNGSKNGFALKRKTMIFSLVLLYMDVKQSESGVKQK